MTDETERLRARVTELEAERKRVVDVLWGRFRASREARFAASSVVGFVGARRTADKVILLLADVMGLRWSEARGALVAKEPEGSDLRSRAVDDLGNPVNNLDGLVDP